MFGVELAGQLKNPTISMGMVCRSPRSAVDLTYFVQTFVEVGQVVPIVFGGGLFLILSRAFESGVYCRAHRAVVLYPAQFFVMAWLPVPISRFGRIRVAGAASCQPAILSCTKAGHEAC